MTNPTTASRIQIDQPRRLGTMVHWEGELRTSIGGTHRIYFEFSTPDSRFYPVQARPFLLAFLLPAMQANAPLELELPIDTVTLNNLMEWQEAMASWHPETLKVVLIKAPLELKPETSREPGALTAFSGGVDSNFTIWRHSQSGESQAFRKTKLRAGLMVQGFDIPLEQEAIFERAWNRSREMLDAFGLKTYRMKTNLRSLEKVPGCLWDKNAHGIWLAAALSCYEPWFGQMLIPSTYAYQKLLFPWGSNPITDPLCSSATTAYWHDGTAYTKLTKMQAIASQPAVQKLLRVCWEGEQLDRNCGHCFKCVTTQICFQLSGVEQMGAFPEPCTMEQVAHLPVKNEQNAWLIRSMCDEAQRQGKNQLACALEQALKFSKRKSPLHKIKKLFRRHIQK
jgi:hypothetical protein